MHSYIIFTFNFFFVILRHKVQFLLLFVAIEYDELNDFFLSTISRFFPLQFKLLFFPVKTYIGKSRWSIYLSRAGKNSGIRNLCFSFRHNRRLELDDNFKVEWVRDRGEDREVKIKVLCELCYNWRWKWWQKDTCDLLGMELKLNQRYEWRFLMREIVRLHLILFYIITFH